MSDERDCEACARVVDPPAWDALTIPPEPIDLVRELHDAVHGATWARPESPQRVWEGLLSDVRALVAADRAWQYITFNALTKSVMLWACSRCRAAIVDKEGHERWHQSIGDDPAAKFSDAKPTTVEEEALDPDAENTIWCPCGAWITREISTRDGRCFDCWERDNPGMFVSRETRAFERRVRGSRASRVSPETEEKP